MLSSLWCDSRLLYLYDDGVFTQEDVVFTLHLGFDPALQGDHTLHYGTMEGLINIQLLSLSKKHLYTQTHTHTIYSLMARYTTFIVVWPDTK